MTNPVVCATSDFRLNIAARRQLGLGARRVSRIGALADCSCRNLQVSLFLQKTNKGPPIRPLEDCELDGGQPMRPREQEKLSLDRAPFEIHQDAAGVGGLQC